MEQEQEQREQILRGQIISFSYNQIEVKQDKTGERKNLYFGGLQKRVLSGLDKNILKRLKRIEWTNSEEFWNIGINLLVGCDRCKNPILSLSFDDDIDDKNICADCEAWVCSEHFDFNTHKCSKCFKKQVARAI